MHATGAPLSHHQLNHPDCQPAAGATRRAVAAWTSQWKQWWKVLYHLKPAMQEMGIHGLAAHLRQSCCGKPKFVTATIVFRRADSDLCRDTHMKPNHSLLTFVLASHIVDYMRCPDGAQTSAVHRQPTQQKSQAGMLNT